MSKKEINELMQTAAHLGVQAAWTTLITLVENAPSHFSPQEIGTMLRAYGVKDSILKCVQATIKEME